MQGFVFIVVFGIVAWYYYHRFRESEIEYFKLHKKFSDAKNENYYLKERISDLELYKQDVSKTFKILDNELLGINEHIKNKSQQPPVDTNDNGIENVNDNNNNNNNVDFQPSQRISILTPEMLGQLFHSMQNEQEHFTSVEEVKMEGEDDLASFNINSKNPNNFDKYLIE